MNTQANIRTNIKPQTETSTTHSLKLRQKAVYLAVASCFAVMPTVSLAFDVTHDGVAGVTQTGSGTNNVVINTTANNTILKWPSFNILAGEKVYFNQTSAASAVLNRVAANGGMSQILGTLGSNGKVFLINPAGVMIGAGAKINTAGFVASSLNMTDSDFLNGKMRFNADTLGAGKVTNAGEISTPNGGFVYLIAPQVANSGVISTPSGEAILAAGHSVELVDSADPAMRVKVSAQSKDINLSNMVISNGGNIFSVLNSGTVSANTAVVGQNGKIQFRSAGKLDTTATSVIEAKGDVNTDGGYFRGFADGLGVYKGDFNASGKNGGFIETSAAYLDFGGISVNAGALSSSGHGGMWLLDPRNITIGITEATSINSSLNSGTNVTIDTSDSLGMYGSDVGNITINSAISKTSGYGAGLNLNADGAIAVNADITDSTGRLSLYMNADQDNNGGGGIAINANINVGRNIYLKTYSGDVTGSGLLTSNSLTIYSYGGNVGTKANFLHVATPNLNIGSSGYYGVKSKKVFIQDESSISFAAIYATDEVGLKVLGGISSGANINIYTSDKALIERSGNLSLDSTTIRFYGGGDDYGVKVAGNMIMNNSGIYAQYGGLQVSADNLGMDNNSHIGESNFSGGDVLVKANTINLNESTIEAYRTNGGSATIVARDLTLDNASDIVANSSFGGSLVSIAAQNVTLRNDSHLRASSRYSVNSNRNKVKINYDENLDAIGGSARDLGKFFTFTKNGSVNIESDSSILANRVGIITGELNITGRSHYTGIHALEVADLIVAGDLNIKATAASNSGGVAALFSDGEVFLAVGGHVKITSDSGSRATCIDYRQCSASIAAGSALFMDFPTQTADGFVVDGVANAFRSNIHRYTGIFVSSGGSGLGSEPGILGVNTKVRYSGLSGTGLSDKNIKYIVKDLSKDQIVKDETLAAKLLKDEKTAEDFFGKDKEETQDEQNVPGQCS